MSHTNVDGLNADYSMHLSLISTRYANPQDFTFTFNVSNGPPTIVNCTDGNDPITLASVDLSHLVVNGPKSVTQVAMAVRMRKAGTFHCTVSNARVEAVNISDIIATNNNSSSQLLTG